MNFGNLLHWVIVFLIVALVAGLLGFGPTFERRREGQTVC